MIYGKTTVCRLFGMFQHHFQMSLYELTTYFALFDEIFDLLNDRF